MASYGQRRRAPPGNPVFHRSFDTASHSSTHDSRSQGRSHGSAPSSVKNSHNNNSDGGSSRRTVRYVNPQRQFDPRYDPRDPQTYIIYHQPNRDEYNVIEEEGGDKNGHGNFSSSENTEYTANGTGRQMQYRSPQRQTVSTNTLLQGDNNESRQGTQVSPLNLQANLHLIGNTPRVFDKMKKKKFTFTTITVTNKVHQ